MNQTVILFSTISVVLLFTQACGTIIQGSTQQIGFSSNPTNASVSINGQNMGNTPMVLHLKRKNSHVVTFELDGYQPYDTFITRSTSGWVWGNLVFGGLIGLVVDASAGGMYKLSPEQVNTQLRSAQVSNMATEDGLFIAVVLEPDPSWEKVGTLTSVK